MPNRRKYRYRVPFSTTFEGEFLEEFRKECETEDKDTNVVLHSLMEEYLRRKHTVREQQKLSIYGYRADQQKIDEIAQIEKESFRLPTEDELIDHLERLQTPQQIGRLQGQYSKGYDKCKTRMNQIKIANLRV